MSRFLGNWTSVDFEPPTEMRGRFATLRRLSVEMHAATLHEGNLIDPQIWRYMAVGPFFSLGDYKVWAEEAEQSTDPIFYAIAGDVGWAGVASMMRVDRDNGVIEIGNITFTPLLQRTPAATEAIHLMIDRAFTCGFRRVEWKCNADNLASRRAAHRLGFSYEGLFRNHMVVKGANRDTAWYAMVEEDWPTLRKAHRDWLTPENFTEAGEQRRSLTDLTEALRGGTP